jgi:hypothetical protein
MITRTTPDPVSPSTGLQPDPLPAWLDDTCRDLLRAIDKPEVAKKRRTVLLLAFALANQIPLDEVFSREDACCKNIWYGDNRTFRNSQIVKLGWRDLPDVRAAFDACYQRALDFADEETANLEAHYRRLRRQAIGKHAAAAPATLASVMDDQAVRASDRINAALSLIKLADPDARDVPTPQPSGDTNQTVTIEAATRLDELLMKALYPEDVPHDAQPGGA